MLPEPTNMHDELHDLEFVIVDQSQALLMGHFAGQPEVLSVLVGPRSIKFGSPSVTDTWHLASF